MVKKKFNLSLQQQVSVALLLVMAALALLSYAILNAVVAPAFDDLELAAAQSNMVRVQRAIEADLNSLTTLSKDWSLWDDAHRYMSGQYEQFEQSNMTLATLVTLEMDLLLFYQLSGELKWGRFMLDEELQELESLGLLGRVVDPANHLLSHRELDAEIRGLIDTSAGPMLISSKPIVKTDGSGPIAGTLIMGRLLDAADLARLQQQTEVDFEWHTLDYKLPLEDPVLRRLSNQPAFSHHQVSTTQIVSYTMLPDLFGKPILALQTKTPRQISALGNRTLNGAMLFLALAAIIVALVTWLLLRSIFVRPMEELAQHITKIRRSGDLSPRLNMQRDDEIGSFANEFDQLTEELSDARQLLLDQSFKAGRADTAAEVLHNIRNAMTPLINGLDRLGQQLHVAGSLKIKQATQALNDSDCQPERRDKLLLYIESAFERILETHDATSEELMIATKQARQVEAILSDQERHSKVAPVFENLDLDEILAEAVLVVPKSKLLHVDVHLADDIGQFRVRGHRVGLLQVLGNVILNAYEAIKRSQSTSGKIRLSASRELLEDRPMIRVTVTDTGCGFDAGEETKIFQRGYSSKRGNMSGLGLHWCANAVAGMGGRIQARSMGEGRGAEFHVYLPADEGG